ncbi:MAG: allophanate hydrolase, partial [Steroidobacteraceae bacterium]
MSASQSHIDRSLAIADLTGEYRARRTTPLELIELLLERIAALSDRGIWISQLTPERVLEQARALCERDPASLPLYGIPFAIKDN